ncbi:MAG: RNA methyltransferase [Bacteroidaceae bacterium]|nr:RNA methyltransferase [Bacteroidaceae bacterium]
MRKLKVTEMGRMSVTEYKASVKQPIVVVLDHVRSLYNVGSVFRSSDAFRIEGVVLCGITAQPPHPEIHKTALGAEESVKWKYFERTEDAISWLKELGYTILAIEQCEGSTMLQDFERLPDRKYAIVLGNEVKGVQQQIVDSCDGCLEIPQYGTKHSLNVSVTAGIVLWHLSKKD